MNLLPELESAFNLLLNPIMFARAKQLGILTPGLADLGRLHHQLGVARIAATKGGTYSPDPDGELALIVPAYEGDVLVDLVAFKSSEPERWWLRTGNGWALGLEYVLDPYLWHGETAELHKTPLAWLQGGCTGLCVVDWTALVQIRGLADLPAVIIGDRELEARLIDALTQPVRLPHIIKDQALAA
jgi:hypothetical protein